MNAWLVGSDRCLTLFGAVYETGRLIFPAQASVLEIGCAEGDWMTPLVGERPDVQLLGVDWRPAGDRPAPVIRGNVLTQIFPAASFDAIVGISSVEHIGLGHYDHDPLDPDGDTHTMQHVVTWLRPGGWVYVDVPYARDGYEVRGTEYRVYDEPSLARLLVPGLTLTQRWYAAHGDIRQILDEPPPPMPGQLTYVALYATKE